MNKKQRSTVLITAGLLAATVLATASTSQAAEKFNWQRFKGQTINVMIQTSTWTDVVQPLVPEFEKLTGIKVNLQVLPEQQARQKLAIDFASGGATVDVFETSLHVEKARFSRAGWYEPLNSRINSDLTDVGYRFDDFFSSNRINVKAADGSIVGLPTKTDVEVLFYRKDLFAAKNIKVPKTIEEVELAAKALHNPPEVYGFAARGLKNANVWSFIFPLRYFGGNWLDKNGKASLNTAAATKALDWYAKMLRNYAPAEAVGFNWGEVLGLFQQGKLAMFTDSLSFATQIEDPSKSKVVGKVGYAVLPGNVAPTTGGALSISSRARSKDASYYFIQWATNKAMNDRLIAANVIAPRMSSWTNAPSKPLETKAWAKTYFDALKVGKPAFPEIGAITEMRDVLGIAIVKAIHGSQSKPALQDANREFQTILDSTEK